MSTQTLTLHLPDRLYARLQQRSQQSNRTLEAELLEVLSTAVPADESLPHPLAEEVSRLDDLDDAALWQAARSRLSAEKSTQLELFALQAPERRSFRDRGPHARGTCSAI